MCEGLECAASLCRSECTELDWTWLCLHSRAVNKETRVGLLLLTGVRWGGVLVPVCFCVNPDVVPFQAQCKNAILQTADVKRRGRWRGSEDRCLGLWWADSRKGRLLFLFCFRFRLVLVLDNSSPDEGFLTWAGAVIPVCCVKSLEGSSVCFRAAQPVIVMSGEEAALSNSSFCTLKSLLSQALKGCSSISRETLSSSACPGFAHQTLLLWWIRPRLFPRTRD